MICMVAEQEGHLCCGRAGGSLGAVAPSRDRQRVRASPRLRLANRPKWRMRTRAQGSTCSRTLLEVDDVNSYSKVVSTDFKQQNMIATLTSLFGLLGLALAAVGLYGVMAYTVEQRTNEIGLRMALGARRTDVITMVLRGAFWQIGIGLGLGIPLAILAGKLMKDQLYGVQPWNPMMLAGAALLLALAALLASVAPVHRAATWSR